MLTTNDFEEGSRETERGARRGFARRDAAPARAMRRRRLIDLLDIAENCLISLGLMAGLASAALLLIRMLAR